MSRRQCHIATAKLTSTDSFKDETDQTASEYQVVVTPPKSVSRSSSEGRSTPSSTIDLPSTGHHLPLYVADSQPGSRSTSANSPQATGTPVGHGQPRLANVNEAYLLRHFQRHLAPWVSSASEVHDLLAYSPISLTPAILSINLHRMLPDEPASTRSSFTPASPSQHATSPEQQIPSP